MYNEEPEKQIEALENKSKKYKHSEGKYVFLDDWNPMIFQRTIARNGTVNNVPFKRLLLRIRRIYDVNVNFEFFSPLGVNHTKSVKLICERPDGNKTITIEPHMLIRTSDPFAFWDGIPASMYRSLDDGFWGAAWLRSVDVDASAEGTYWLLARDMLHVGKDSRVYQHTPPQKTISFHKFTI